MLLGVLNNGLHIAPWGWEELFAVVDRWPCYLVDLVENKQDQGKIGIIRLFST